MISNNLIEKCNEPSHNSVIYEAERGYRLRKADCIDCAVAGHTENNIFYPEIECVNCHDKYDVRDTFFLMDIPYCSSCVVFPMRLRLTKEERLIAASEIITVEVTENVEA